MADCRDRVPGIPERIAGLSDLAFNMWWSWHPEARELFKMLKRAAWKLSVHNPVGMLRSLDGQALQNAAGDAKFLRHYDAVLSRFSEDITPGGGWFYDNIRGAGLPPVAFFSAEYGLHHSLPFYAGGLGFLAGDFLKECSDLDVPLVAVGFMYPEGYVRQKMSPDGWQLSESEPIDREEAPICRVLDERGERLIVKVPVIEPPVYVEVWQVQVGKVPLYLIDTATEANDPWNREITSHLYAGNPEQRLRQEIVLGIGGTEVLNALGIRHSVLHMNEGHSAFAILERVRERVERGMGFEEAFEEVRSTTIFTTHTPVPAGHDVYPFPLMEKYFNSYWPSLGLDRETFLKLGVNPERPGDGFNMSVLALRASQYHNGVSRKNAEVVRRMWRSLWPDLPEEKVPITHITNGVHVPTWVEPKVHLLFNEHLGPRWHDEHDSAELWRLVRDIPDRDLWQTHRWLKMKLILRILERTRARWLENNPDSRVILATGVLLEPNALTIGFSRRFTTYKRAALILEDVDRLRKMLNDRWRPVQIIFAGKAHPDDQPGKEMLKRVFNAAEDPSFGGRIAFVEDYDEQLAQYLVHGVDVWLNNPLPPLEACGTSGMKAAINGVPHLSIPDGWWVEGYNGANGWSFGSEQRAADRDAADSRALYDMLETRVIPLYYDIDDEGVPRGWVQVMKESIISVAPYFSARRMVKEYAGKFYKLAMAAASKEAR
jgi:starch phosphorylase